MTLYLLDTNIISAAAKKPDGVVAQTISGKPRDALMTSVIVAAEIEFGLASGGSAKTAVNMRGMLNMLRVEPFESSAVRHYAEVRSTLKRLGTPIGPNDLLIAAHALALGATLVTANEIEFARVPGLKIENWLR